MKFLDSDHTSASVSSSVLYHDCDPELSESKTVQTHALTLSYFPSYKTFPYKL